MGSGGFTPHDERLLQAQQKTGLERFPGIAWAMTLSRFAPVPTIAVVMSRQATPAHNERRPQSSGRIHCPM
ncbi:hypothetical protein, partial [Pseudomonas brassicacearum]|uniref:hypothetical protein n=1 Tax=Pseudomonas brassicacearum TaxID=930166 RepID=UPI001C82BEDC